MIEPTNTDVITPVTALGVETPPAEETTNPLVTSDIVPASKDKAAEFMKHYRTQRTWFDDTCRWWFKRSFFTKAVVTIGLTLVAGFISLAFSASISLLTLLSVGLLLLIGQGLLGLYTKNRFEAAKQAAKEVIEGTQSFLHISQERLAQASQSVDATCASATTIMNEFKETTTQVNSISTRVDEASQTLAETVTQLEIIIDSTHTPIQTLAALTPQLQDLSAPHQKTREQLNELNELLHQKQEQLLKIEAVIKSTADSKAAVITQLEQVVTTLTADNEKLRQETIERTKTVINLHEELKYARGQCAFFKQVIEQTMPTTAPHHHNAPLGMAA